MVKGDISFYVDTLVIETALGNPAFLKTGQGSALSGLADMVKNYFSAHFDENNKTNSVINMLAPAGISLLFRAIGFGKIGWLLGAAASALHIDVAGMLESIYNSVKGSLSHGGQVNPSVVDSAVSQAVQEQTSGTSDQGQALDSRSLDQELRDARLVRLAFEQYDTQLFQLRKEGAPSRGLFGGATRGAAGSLIGRIIGFVFKLILASAGLMVAGDLVNKFLGRPNALDQNYQAGQTSAATPAAPEPTTTQTKFKVNPGYQASTHPRPWVERITNDPASIENMLVDMTKQVYSGLDGKEVAIRMSPTFQAVKDQIAWYNHSSPGDNFIYIPPNYGSVKDIVDHYIDEVAKNAQ
jgi:hypothetical protein